MRHILDLVANPKSAPSHVDAVYSRKCISFILRSVLGQILSEKAQSSACKELALIVKKQMSSIGKTKLKCINIIHIFILSYVYFRF